jgi:plastocyanin
MVKLFLIVLIFIIQFSAYSKEVVVEIYKKEFIPAHITINVGDTVIWKNIEKRQYHNVWFKQLVKDEPDYIFPDETYQRDFATVGEFPYECGPHPKMKGVVIVVE